SLLRDPLGPANINDSRQKKKSRHPPVIGTSKLLGSTERRYSEPRQDNEAAPVRGVFNYRHRVCPDLLHYGNTRLPLSRVMTSHRWVSRAQLLLRRRSNIDRFHGTARRYLTTSATHLPPEPLQMAGNCPLAMAFRT